MTKIALMLLAGATVSTAALADTTAMSRDEVRSMVSEMLSDAETRSSLLQGGGMAGYDKGFMIGSADGNWKMKINGLIQFRYVSNFRDKDNIAPGADDLTHGFQMRKVRLTFSGNAVNPNLTYFIALEDSDTSGDAAGLWRANDLYFGYNLQDGWKVRGGQYKLGFLKEELLSESATLSMERGIMNNVFNQGRSQGVGFTYESNDWKWAFDLSDGLNSATTDFNASTTTAGTTVPAEWSITARGEWKWAGSWEALADYTCKPGDAQAGSVGFAGTYQHGNEPAALTDSQDFWALTADVQWEGNGWNAFAAFVYSDIEQASDSINHCGLTAQVGYRWNETSEVFAKYDGIFLDQDDAGVVTTLDDNISFATFGYNHYFAGNAAKFTVDCIVAFSETANLSTANFGPMNGSAESTQNGLLGSSDSGEFAIRAQFQLAF